MRSPGVTPLPPPDALTLARYLSGELSAAEAAEVERWIEANPANGEQVEALRAVWARGSAPEFDPDDAVWRRIAARLEPPCPKPALVRDSRRCAAARLAVPWPVRRARVLPAAAAAGVILAIAGAAWFARARQEPVPLREIATRRGQRAALDLPDGSRVVIAPDSRLRYAAGTRGRSAARELFLEGQAYFEVRHDSIRPFRVHTATGIAEDLGTEFIVAAYPETPRTDVVVVSGVVALHRSGGGGEGRPLLTLTRGDLGRIDSAGGAVLTRDVNLAPYVAWTTGSLVFDGTPVRDAVPALERWYDLDIELADSALGDRRLTASFHYEPASQVLELVARSLDARIEQRGRQVVLSSGRP